MIKNFIVFAALITCAIPAFSQECTFDAQAELNQCIVDAAASCAEAAPDCTSGVELEHWVVTRFKELCCCRNGAPVSAAKFSVCKAKKVHDLGLLKSLLLSFGTTAIQDIKALKYDQCDIPCDY